MTVSVWHIRRSGTWRGSAPNLCGAAISWYDQSRDQAIARIGFSSVARPDFVEPICSGCLDAMYALDGKAARRKSAPNGDVWQPWRR